MKSWFDSVWSQL